MKTILKKFTNEPLFDACAAMLSHLHILFNEVTRTPIPFDSLYPGPLTKALQEIIGKVEHTYFIGTVDEASLSGHATQQDEGEVTHKAAEGKYVGMMIFAVNIINGQTLTRTEMATLTRGFNRIAAAQPVVLFIKQGDRLALSTCERSEYTQQWRDGEKLGKVSMLRNIKCENPQRGHLDILESIGDKAYPNFEELYKHWMQVFSSELLTKKFYGELSDWYAWAVQVARFPNDLTTTADDEKFNHESCIRLITRLIFVWFLKQKHLIPKEFFDERYIREHFIEEFNPHDRENLLYNPEKSRYYRLILQNLFFAMLNRPIVPEGKDTPNNRRFRVKGTFHGMNPDYAVNNLLRYEGDFKQGGAEEFLKMANSSVPFLNGGLFDCLDDKPRNLYYDGFSERKESLEQLYLPDWLFFGEEVGRSIDLSEWYGDAKKKKVSARGIIDILKRYNFTIEENTPLDQEVSLDPELLGKAFENLLASYNPETKTSARKQTGSFYTPREIVQYMVDECIVAHLKRTCGEELEPQYRSLLSYSTEETTLSIEQRRNIMQALYNCRVLDPACGSGAFPMGVLQQMVHILQQLDPTNEMWQKYMEDTATEQSRNAFAENRDNDLQERLADIGESFNTNVNDPDYARKLYLIEHCIFGVDIQPIAVQISKLRFFISLVVDQKPTDDASHNFGIRPLPNLESKFVAANTLIPVKYDAMLVESAPEVRKNKDKLRELNHKIFLAKRNIDKQRLKNEIKLTRKALSMAIEDTGFVGHSEADLLASWDMFEQNSSCSYFDAEWMFGLKGGFDIVIANPPYVTYKGKEKVNITDKELNLLVSIYQNSAEYKVNSYALFIEAGLNLCAHDGCLSYIIPSTLLQNDYLKKIRKFILSSHSLQEIVSFENKVFEAVTDSIVIVCKEGCRHKDKMRFKRVEDTKLTIIRECFYDTCIWNNPEKNYVIDIKTSTGLSSIFDKMEEKCNKLDSYFIVYVGIVANGIKKFLATSKLTSNYKKYLQGKHIGRFCTKYKGLYINFIPSLLHSNTDQTVYEKEEKVLVRKTGNVLLATLDTNQYYTDQSIYNLYIRKGKDYNYRLLLAILNSTLLNVYYKGKFTTNADVFPYIKGIHLKQFPLPPSDGSIQNIIVKLVDKVLCMKQADSETDTSLLELQIDLFVYHLYGLTYDEVLIVDPETPITREEYESNN